MTIELQMLVDHLGSSPKAFRISLWMNLVAVLEFRSTTARGMASFSSWIRGESLPAEKEEAGVATTNFQPFEVGVGGMFT